MDAGAGLRAGVCAPGIGGVRHEHDIQDAFAIERGAAVEVADAEEIATALLRWLDDPEALRAAGERAAAYVEENLGAAERNADLVAGLLV